MNVWGPLYYTFRDLWFTFLDSTVEEPLGWNWGELEQPFSFAATSVSWQSTIRSVDFCTATKLTILGVVLLHLSILCPTFTTWKKEGNGWGFTTFKAPPLGHDFNHQLTTVRQKEMTSREFKSSIDCMYCTCMNHSTTCKVKHQLTGQCLQSSSKVLADSPHSFPRVYKVGHVYIYTT